MAATLDSPGAYPESPLESDDLVYPCKGCGEILEEGKAFELAGNRWHIDCFRCNTCGTLLDSDANLLLLGDGSLICNNCTYSCNACGNKIEDLAILTGDQAFCSSCFRCRNCKRKIENLRYARTSQGIFCMTCHESLMARRRKKSKPTSKTGQNGTSGTTTVREKALPSLPPGAVPQSAFTPESETPLSDPPHDASTPRSPSEKQNRSRRDGPPANALRAVSPLSDDGRRDGPTLPASTYGDARSPNTSPKPDDGDEQGFLPMSFDPTAAPGPPPISRKQVPRHQETSPPISSDGRSRDHLGKTPAQPVYNNSVREEQRPSVSRSGSADRDPERKGSQSRSSPHILYQDKGRQTKSGSSSNNTPNTSGKPSPAVTNAQPAIDRPATQALETGSSTLVRNDELTSGDAPRPLRTTSASRLRSEPRSPVSPGRSSFKDGQKDRSLDAPAESAGSPISNVSQFDDSRRRDQTSQGSAAAASAQGDRPVRGDSLTHRSQPTKQATPEPPTSPRLDPSSLRPAVDRRVSATSIPGSFVDAQSTISRNNSRSKRAPSPTLRTSFDAPPPRASSRPTVSNKPLTYEDFKASRDVSSPSSASPVDQVKPNESASSLNGESRLNPQLSLVTRTPSLPKTNLDGGFSMEEEMARIWQGDSQRDRQTGESAGPAARRSSGAVKHGRSISDRGLATPGKGFTNGASDSGSPVTISSPILSSPNTRDSTESLAAQLRRAQQRIAELETANRILEGKVNASSEIKAATNELREKRTTIVVLDTQREMVVRELEAMTEHLSRAKNSNQPLDLGSMKSDILKDFAESLQKLKDQMSAQIEDLMHKRNELTEEIGNLIQMKDKGFQEYENLSSKNAQLLEVNTQILHNIQEMYKSNRSPNGTTNGLGIYHPGAKLDQSGPSDVRNLNLVSTDPTMPNFLQESEAESATMLNAPQMVSIRKGQPKKFNWRRGGENLAKNVTKGIRGAFGKEGDPAYGQPLPPGGSDQAALAQRQQQPIDANKPGAPFGFFGQKNGAPAPRPGTVGNTKQSGSSTNLALDPSVLFGSELEARCEYEKRVIPAVVSRCIEEVESRGMDMEGIYRKSGGSGQVKTVQQGFEKDANYDISDPDLDIHAVTSALKQFFRKLPTPLVTYDVYDAVLEAGKLLDAEKQSLALRLALAELPEHHHNCLEFLFHHLARIVAHQSANLMTPLNLAVVFAPTIMRPLSIEREMTDMQAQRAAIQALLENHQAVFADDDE